MVMNVKEPEANSEEEEFNANIDDLCEDLEGLSF